MGRRQVVTSLRHALVLLGRRQLRVWLQLLLYTSDRANRSLNSPLLQLAAARGKLMEQLAARQAGTQGALKDLAFMTGILSLMDVLLEMPLTDVLTELNVPVPVEAALLRREGELGALLALTEQLEKDDSAGVTASLHKLSGVVKEGELMSLQLAAYRWANEVAAST
jgi:EAL and modified HD-GYP domain-containing signal transduction protein